jgi:SAM-dependent methyltransferase
MAKQTDPKRRHQQECPICGIECESFEPGGPTLRARAMCPECHSLERQRLAWLYMTTEMGLLSDGEPKRLLHISPEPSLEHRFAREPLLAQLTADLDPAGVMVQMDVTDIQRRDGSFDVIYCSHVLEHVSDDARAMGELCRVLAPEGWAILQVPIWDQATDEDPRVRKASERTRRFGQHDHVRRYGRDYPDRLAQAGFRVLVDPYPRRIGLDCVERFGLTLQEEIHIVRKNPGKRPGTVRRLLTELVERPPAAGEVVGRIEQIRDGVVTGWAWKPDDPGLRVAVQALLDGREVAGDVADRHRDALAHAGIGDGHHCFRLQLPDAARAPGYHRLRIEAEGGYVLPPASGFSTAIAHCGDPWYVIDVEPSDQPKRR